MSVEILSMIVFRTVSSYNYFQFSSHEFPSTLTNNIFYIVFLRINRYPLKPERFTTNSTKQWLCANFKVKFQNGNEIELEMAQPLQVGYDLGFCFIRYAFTVMKINQLLIALRILRRRSLKWASLTFFLINILQALRSSLIYT